MDGVTVLEVSFSRVVLSYGFLARLSYFFSKEGSYALKEGLEMVVIGWDSGDFLSVDL